MSTRTALAALEVWLLTVVAHSLAGGGIPATPWLLAVGGVVLLATAVVMRGLLPVWGAAAGLVVVQLGLHVALTATSPVGSMSSGVEHHGHAMPTTAAEPSLLDALTGISAPMALAHLASALVSGLIWWLRRRAVEVVLRLVALVPLTAPVRGEGGRLGNRRRPRPHARPWLLGDPGRAPPAAYVAT